VVRALEAVAERPPRRRPDPGAARGRLTALASSAKPVSLANDRVLPAVPGLADLLPDGGLRRGSTLAVVGATSLALAVAAGPSVAGSWCAAVGTAPIGLVAAAEMGIALERFPLIRATGRAWVKTVAATLEAFDVVLAWPVRGVSSEEARRLTALGRERGAVLVTCGPGWPERPDLRLEAIRSEWIGLELGHGRLRARWMEVAAVGRGAASMERRAALWLPSLDGRIIPLHADPLKDMKDVEAAGIARATTVAGGEPVAAEASFHVVGQVPTAIPAV
jgi:hypothetical protein